MLTETMTDQPTTEISYSSNRSSPGRGKDRSTTNGATSGEIAVNDSNGSGAASLADFEALLKAYEPSLPTRGEIVEGTILKLKGNIALVDIGAKRDAIVPPQEMDAVDESYLDSLEEGHAVPVYVTDIAVGSQELTVLLVRGLEEQDWMRAEACLTEGELLTEDVCGYNKGGLLVTFGRLKAFVPNSHIPALRTVRNRQEATRVKSQMIDSPLPVKVLEIDRQRKRLVMSAKLAREEKREEQLEELQIGDIVKGRVMRLTDYGAFVDLGSVSGLLHISELSWEHVDVPADELGVGEEIEVIILDIDRDRQRISLSRKQLLPDPFDQFAERFGEGDAAMGQVTDLVDFGAFVRLPSGVEGLIHTSEMELGVDQTPADILERDQEVTVLIASIDPARQRIGLSLRRAPKQVQEAAAPASLAAAK